jgi:hypothetical protein
MGLTTPHRKHFLLLRNVSNRVGPGLILWHDLSNGPKREEDGSWRKLHNDEIHSLYSSPNIVRVIKSRRMRWAGHVARIGEGRGFYRDLGGRPEGKRPLGTPRLRWKDNIKLDLRKIWIDGMNWIPLAQDRVQWRACVNTAMNLRIP